MKFVYILYKRCLALQLLIKCIKARSEVEKLIKSDGAILRLSVGECYGRAPFIYFKILLKRYRLVFCHM